MTPSPRRDWGVGALLAGFVLISAVLYIPAAGAPPLLDEAARLQVLAGGTPASALAFQEHPDESRPLANLARHALARAGGSITWIRYASAGLHGLTAGIVFLLCRALLRRRRGATQESLAAPAGAAVIFLAHPLASEALLSYGGFSLVMATFLGFLSLLMAALDAAHEGPPRPFAPAALYLAALLCDASVWPFAFLAAGLALREVEGAAAPGWRPYARSLRPYAAGLALVYLSWTVRLWPTMAWLEARRAWGLLEGIASQAAAFVSEVKMLVAPSGLSVHHGDFAYAGGWTSAQTLAGAAMLALVIAAGVVLGRRPTIGGLATGAFAALHLHALFFPPVEPIQERRLYAATAAASMLCAAGLLLLERRAGARVSFAAAAVLAAPLSLMAVERTRLWNDPILLWESAAENSPQSPVPHVVMGGIHLASGAPDRSLQSFESALARAPRNAGIQQSIAEVYARKGDYERAAQEAGKALQLDPNSFGAYLTAGTAYMMRNRPREAFLMFNEALRLRPQDASALMNMGALLYEQRRFGRAAALLEDAAKARPRDPEILFRLGMSRLNAGDLAGGAEALRGCITEAPDRVDARVNLGSILTQLGHHEEARLMLQSAVDTDPGNAVALNGLAVLASSQQRYEEARELFERAASSDPNDHRVLFNLAGIYERLGERVKAAEAYRAFLDRWSGSIEMGEAARARLDALEARASR